MVGRDDDFVVACGQGFEQVFHGRMPEPALGDATIGCLVGSQFTHHFRFRTSMGKHVDKVEHNDVQVIFFQLFELADKFIGRSRIIDFMITECILTAVTVQLGLDERTFVQVLALFFVFVHPEIRVHLGDFVRHQTGKDGVARILCGCGQDAAINIFVDEEHIRQFRTECPPLVVTEVVQNDEKHLFPLIQQGEYFGFEDIRTH